MHHKPAHRTDQIAPFPVQIGGFVRRGNSEKQLEQIRSFFSRVWRQQRRDEGGDTIRSKRDAPGDEEENEVDALNHAAELIEVMREHQECTATMSDDLMRHQEECHRLEQQLQVSLQRLARGCCYLPIEPRHT